MIQINGSDRSLLSFVTISSGDLNERWGSLSYQAALKMPRQFSNVRAHKRVDLKNVKVEGLVRSEWESIIAIKSALNRVWAHQNVDLIDSSVSHVTSDCGNVSIIQSRGTPRRISYIQAHQSIYLKGTIVEGQVKAVHGNVTARQSHLNRVFAHQDISLINSSAHALVSDLGKITVQQLDGQKRQFYSLQAYAGLDIENSSVNDLTCFGPVHIENSSIKNLVCRQQATVHNSTLQNLTLSLGSDEGILDLKGTVVEGTIYLKVDNVNKIQKAISAFFSTLFENNLEKANDTFTLLVKNHVMPERLFCEGYKLSYQSTERGILVRGSKF